MTDDMTTDEVIESETTVWTAQECADELCVSAKSLRASLRAFNRDAGLPTPGAGGEWRIDVPTDDAERAAFFDWLRHDVMRAGSSKRVASFGRPLA